MDNREKYVEELMETIVEKKEIEIKKCFNQLILDVLKQDVSDWDKEKIEKFLKMRGYQMVISATPLGSVVVGIMNLASKTVNKAYEIFLDFENLPDGSVEIKLGTKSIEKKKKVK